LPLASFSAFLSGKEVPEWRQLPEETVLRKAGAAALVQAIMKSRADEPVAAIPRNAKGQAMKV
jgi:hypothetical protein